MLLYNNIYCTKEDQKDDFNLHCKNIPSILQRKCGMTQRTMNLTSGSLTVIESFIYLLEKSRLDTQNQTSTATLAKTK